MSPTEVHELSAFLNVLINDSLASNEYGGGNATLFCQAWSIQSWSGMWGHKVESSHSEWVAEYIFFLLFFFYSGILLIVILWQVLKYWETEMNVRGCVENNPTY